jgi:proteic killer suppression protein
VSIGLPRIVGGSLQPCNLDWRKSRCGESFCNRLTEDLFFDRQSREMRGFPPELRRPARRKLPYLHDASELGDLRVPPDNRLESLKGEWRVVFRWQGGRAAEVRVVDYH